MKKPLYQHNRPLLPVIGVIWHKNGERPAEQWHTDHTIRERPPAATILYGVEIPSAGGGTSVASMRAAYLALPEDERRQGPHRWHDTGGEQGVHGRSDRARPCDPDHRRG